MKAVLTSLIGFLMVISTTSVAHEAYSLTPPKVSVQLWSVKDQLKDDFEATVEALAQMGFDGVEFAGDFGPFNEDANGLRLYLDSLGMVASGAHVSFEQLNDESFTETVAFYQALGTKVLIVGWDKRAWDPKGIDFVVNELNRISLKLKPLGIKFGFHNHEHEFNGFKGTTFWDYLAENTLQDVILQQDVGWTTYAGRDPIEYVRRYPGRTITTHYKVKLPERVEGKLPIIGQDTIDWLALTKANIAVGGTQWLVVEQEEYPNGLTPLQAVEKSKLGLDNILKQL
ncbi:sugar phosphate isomerase/epimerase family protein [Shewanella woodyi]|uniref:sugar phosphate isomerase/epimerase family protein n=1 Tax=Shewanella woodyi TaxID=60961 RepID=UPI0007F8FFC2|nr:sugar phosphate isomerase/epimerase [Shewanella woodyi]